MEILTGVGVAMVMATTVPNLLTVSGHNILVEVGNLLVFCFRDEVGWLWCWRLGRFGIGQGVLMEGGSDKK